MRWPIDVLVLSLLFSIPFLHALGSFPFMDPDEGRYAETPREMIESGDFITPHLDYAKFFLKPPLCYWLTAASLKALGENEFAARLPSALCGLLTVLLVYFAGRKTLGRREGLLAAMILGTSGGFFVCSRLVLIDMPLTLCMASSLCFFLLAAGTEGRERAGYVYLFYACMALAVLAKGLIGILLPVMIVFFYILFTWRWRLCRELFRSGPLLVFLLVCAPWFILVSAKNPEFPEFFFIREHFQRYFSQVHERHEPFWYLIPIFIGMMFPWTFFLPGAVSFIWRERRSPGAGPRLFFVLWAVCIFVFFSSSESILATYILPIFPAVALLIAATLAGSQDNAPRAVLRQACAAAVVLCAGGAFGVVYPIFFPLGGTNPFGFSLVGVVVLAAGWLSLKKALARDLAAACCILFAAVYFLEMTAGETIPRLYIERKSSKRLALAARAEIRPGTLLASYLNEPSVIFYTRKKVIVVDPPETSDLKFGSSQAGEPDLFLNAGQFIRKWDSGAEILVIMNDSDAAWLRPRVKAPLTLVARQGEKLLVSNRPRQRPALN